jgi:HK97 family phage major capsid protein
MSTTTQERLEAAVKNLKDYADEVDAAGATPSGEQLGELKNRMAEVKDLKEAVKGEAEARGEIAEAQAFLKSLSGTEDTKATERDSVTLSGLPTQTNGKTFGEMFVESPAYTEFVGRYAGKGGVIPNSMKGIQSGPFQTPDLKALLTGASSTSAGALVVNDRYGPLTDLVGERELTVRDLVTIGSTQSDTVEYVRTTARTNNAATVAEATSSAAPTVVNVEGTPNIATVTNNAGGGYKPESSRALEVVSATVKTIAHRMPLTKRAASDVAQVRTLVDNFLSYGLNEELEDQILNGSGTGEDFGGIMDDGTPIQTTGSAGTDIDAIVDAIRKIRVTGRRRPTALVIHPNDWYSTGFLLAKDGENRYLVGDPRASVEQLNQLWGLKVVVSEAITENTALVGDFRQAVLWEREGISLTVSDQHADFFVRNLLAILAEMRAAFGVLDPEAFCSVTSV